MTPEGYGMGPIPTLFLPMAKELLRLPAMELPWFRWMAAIRNRSAVHKPARPPSVGPKDGNALLIGRAEKLLPGLASRPLTPAPDAMENGSPADVAGVVGVSLPSNRRRRRALRLRIHAQPVRFIPRGTPEVDDPDYFLPVSETMFVAR